MLPGKEGAGEDLTEHRRSALLDTRRNRHARSRALRGVASMKDTKDAMRPNAAEEPASP
jgi:hypothetical protein